MTEARIEVVVLGRILGSASGWDMAGDTAYQFYDFEPIPGVDLAECSQLVFDWTDGALHLEDKDGEPTQEPLDAAEFCAKLPKL